MTKILIQRLRTNESTSTPEKMQVLLVVWPSAHMNLCLEREGSGIQMELPWNWSRDSGWTHAPLTVRGRTRSSPEGAGPEASGCGWSGSKVFGPFLISFEMARPLSPPILKSKLETWCPFTPKYCSVHFPARCSPTEHSSVNTIRKSSTNSTTIREGNGNPLHYSCLENPMAREAWWAAVHGAAQSWT